ncbi:glycosyltransferase family 4 protein, partial [Kitasatospora sp. MY 5-36]|uniref:glycosyltransferase family 4 protein n=1 Tax=Kitasatospora sp. MY 5-36 TaxID=1678027 RepID=UPI000671314B
ARLVPGVDPAVFRPAAEDSVGEASAAPVVLCVARLVPRKGQDVLIRALPAIRRAVPGTTLVLVGRGPDEDRLRGLALRLAEPGSVVFTGGLDHAATAVHYAEADVFAMPCRTRRLGLEAEGLGIVFLEAAAAGLPVVVGRSGGAPDTVLDGVTGAVVNGRAPAEVAAALTRILLAPPAER